jgi:hypothetical protein
MTEGKRMHSYTFAVDSGVPVPKYGQVTTRSNTALHLADIILQLQPGQSVVLSWDWMAAYTSYCRLRKTMPELPRTTYAQIRKYFTFRVWQREPNDVPEQPEHLHPKK